jgi:toxin YoeB
MIENVGFTIEGLKHYFHWQSQDKRTLKKINQLIQDIIRNGNVGLGHPERRLANLSI